MNLGCSLGILRLFDSRFYSCEFWGRFILPFALLIGTTSRRHIRSPSRPSFHHCIPQGSSLPARFCRSPHMFAQDAGGCAAVDGRTGRKTHLWPTVRHRWLDCACHRIDRGSSRGFNVLPNLGYYIGNFVEVTWLLLSFTGGHHTVRHTRDRTPRTPPIRKIRTMGTPICKRILPSINVQRGTRGKKRWRLGSAVVAQRRASELALARSLLHQSLSRRYACIGISYNHALIVSLNHEI